LVCFLDSPHKRLSQSHDTYTHTGTMSFHTIGIPPAVEPLTASVETASDIATVADLFPAAPKTALFLELQSKSRVRHRVPMSAKMYMLKSKQSSLRGNFGMENAELTMHAKARSDVWAYNLDTRQWQQAEAPKVQPSARWMHSTVVNEKEKKAHGAVIFGGCNNTLTLLHDVWEYKWPSTWNFLWPQNEADAAKGPSPREGHCAAMGMFFFISSFVLSL